MKDLTSMIRSFWMNRQYRHCFYYLLGMIILFYGLLYIAFIWKTI